MAAAKPNADILSKIACHNCRRRKTCSYPDRVLKPGPKLGSRNARSKRRRSSISDNEEPDSNGRAHGEDIGPMGSSEAEPRTAVSPCSPETLNASREMQSLSFIIHPSHEPTSPNDQRLESPSQTFANGGAVILSACSAMHITSDVLMVLVDNFFKTFMSYRLFPRSRFWTNLGQIQDEEQAKAFLAAIVAFSVKLWEPDESQISLNPLIANLSHSNMIDLAMRSADKALTDCGDDAPPLHLLQALVLISHWLLIQGVRGRAWRYLGSCVRVAYEINLHLVDYGRSHDWLDDDVTRWVQDEEKRRTWWAIWEMDVFASVIRRCPTAVNWLQNETFLPAEDEHWEQKRPRQSCLLEITTLSRCKSLQLTGNQSPWAWFIVINSIMKDAQTISSPMGVDKSAAMDSLDAKSAAQYLASVRTERIEETRRRLTTYYNAARYFTMALPQTLKYRGQYLSFDIKASANGQAGLKLLRELHTSIYSIHLMTQLAFLMTLKYHLFKLPPPTTGEGHFGQAFASQNQAEAVLGREQCKSQKDIEEYFEAASSILHITNRSSDQLHRHVNPFLVNTIWLAAAVQLLKRELFCANNSEKDLVTSNFEVLRMSYDMSVEFWRSNDTAKKNLVALQDQLKSFQAKTRGDANSRSSQNQTIPNNDARQTLNASLNGNAVQTGATRNHSTAVAQPTTPVSMTNNSLELQAGQAQQLWSTTTVPVMDNPAAMQPSGEQSFDFDFLDPFNLPNEFDFTAGVNTFNNFGDAFSGSVF